MVTRKKSTVKKITKDRNAPSNSTEGEQELLDSALMGEIKPPACVKLRKQDVPFWAAIIKARAKADWIDSDLIVAAQLARCQADIEDEQSRLGKEKSIILNRRGSKVMNPRFFVLERLTSRELSLVRTLKIAYVSAPGHKTRDMQENRREEEKLTGPLAKLSPDELGLLGIGGGGLH